METRPSEPKKPNLPKPPTTNYMRHLHGFDPMPGFREEHKVKSKANQSYKIWIFLALLGLAFLMFALYAWAPIDPALTGGQFVLIFVIAAIGIVFSIYEGRKF